MARISLDPPKTLTTRIVQWFSRRRFGTELEPGLAMSHHPKVLRTYARMEMSAEKWSAVSQELKQLAVMAAAATVGCEWCMDFGYWVGITEGIDPPKVRDLSRWRVSTVYSDLERAVIEYAEAASSTPIAVSDDLVARLRDQLRDDQLVELTMMIAIENERARFNASLGLASQGFKDRCEIPTAR